MLDQTRLIDHLLNIENGLFLLLVLLAFWLSVILICHTSYLSGDRYSQRFLLYYSEKSFGILFPLVELLFREEFLAVISVIRVLLIHLCNFFGLAQDIVPIILYFFRLVWK